MFTRANIDLRFPLALACAAALGLAGFLVAGTNAQGATHARASSASVSLRATKLGSVLVNSKGRTLYLFTKDKNAKSSCTGTCATYWPPAIAPAKPTAGSGAKAALLGTTMRSDGRKQLTYNHHPLYGFALDKKAGQTDGQAQNAFGGRWWAVAANGSAVKKAAGTTTTTATTTTTGTTTTTSDTTTTRYP